MVNHIRECFIFFFFFFHVVGSLSVCHSPPPVTTEAQRSSRAVASFGIYSLFTMFLDRENISTFFILHCVCVFSSHLFWTSSLLEVPAGVTQEERHTGFLIHLPFASHAFIFLARRIQPFFSLVDREVETCVVTI